jgi:hypothetical protein
MSATVKGTCAMKRARYAEREHGEVSTLTRATVSFRHSQAFVSSDLVSRCINWQDGLLGARC